MIFETIEFVDNWIVIAKLTEYVCLRSYTFPDFWCQRLCQRRTLHHAPRGCVYELHEG